MADFAVRFLGCQVSQAVRRSLRSAAEVPVAGCAVNLAAERAVRARRT